MTISTIPAPPRAWIGRSSTCPARGRHAVPSNMALGDPAGSPRSVAWASLAVAGAVTACTCTRRCGCTTVAAATTTSTLSSAHPLPRAQGTSPGLRPRPWPAGPGRRLPSIEHPHGRGRRRPRLAVGRRRWTPGHAGLPGPRIATHARPLSRYNKTLTGSVTTVTGTPLTPRVNSPESCPSPELPTPGRRPASPAGQLAQASSPTQLLPQPRCEEHARQQPPATIRRLPLPADQPAGRSPARDPRGVQPARPLPVEASMICARTRPPPVPRPVPARPPGREHAARLRSGQEVRNAVARGPGRRLRRPSRSPRQMQTGHSVPRTRSRCGRLS